METISTPAAMRAHADAARCAGRRLALVPTMGALHDGHLALVRHAKALSDHVAVSIFVNPTQFGPGEDFERYPRTLDADRARLAELEVDALYTPSPAAMYPDGPDAGIWVVPEGLDRTLCGAHRPGHFRGVTTVVTKLFGACRPDVAVFGKKDAQQFVILKRLARALDLGVEVVGLDTVREADGLALSSRNRYLAPEERAQALVLSRAVAAAERAIAAGEREAPAVQAAMRDALAEAPLGRVQYADVVDAETLQPIERLTPGREALAAVAVYFGETRLIDNAFVPVPRAA